MSTLKEEREKLLHDSRGKIQRPHTRDPWLDLPFRGLLPCDGKWIDLRRHEMTGIISGRALPEGMGVCDSCHGWRPNDSAEPCEDPPQTKGPIGPDGERADDHPSRWYELECFTGASRNEFIATYSPSRAPLHLYWAETGDHDEDWFIIAKNSRQACSLHENYEGYEHGEAWATRISAVPSHWLCHGVGWPHSDTSILEDCGGKQLNYTSKPDDPRSRALRHQMGVVEAAWEFNGTVYTAGDIVGNVMNRMNRSDT